MLKNWGSSVLTLLLLFEKYRPLTHVCLLLEKPASGGRQLNKDYPDSVYVVRLCSYYAIIEYGGITIGGPCFLECTCFQRFFKLNIKTFIGIFVRHYWDLQALVHEQETRNLTLH